MTAATTDPSQFGFGSDSFFGNDPTSGSIPDPTSGSTFSPMAPKTSYAPGADTTGGGASGFDFNGMLPDWNNPQGQVTPGQPVTPAATAPATTPATTTGTTPATTTGAPATTSGGSGSFNTGWDWLDNFLNGLTGGKGFGSTLGGMAPYLADFAIAQKMADKTQAANQKTLQPLYDTATKYLDAASKELGLYESGTITPAQQLMLDQNAASHKAAIAQFYGSNGIQNSSMEQTQVQQVDDSTVIMKQGFVDDSLKKALALEGAGIVPLMTAVQDKLISDTELSKTMMELMGNLAKAWAYQTASGDGGGGGGSAPGKPSDSLLQKGEKWVVNKAGQWVKDKVSDIFGGGDPTGGLDAGGLPIASDLTSFGAPDLSALSSMDMGINFGADAASTYTPTLGIPLTGPAAAADTAAYAPDAIEATTPGASMSTLAGLGIGVAAFAAWYGAARLLAGTGKMSDADWVKKNAGNYATAKDAYNAALKSGNTDEAFKQATSMSESAWSAATHYAAMGDQANAAKYLAIYKQLTANGSWYNTQLVNRSGGATSGQHGSKKSKLL